MNPCFLCPLNGSKISHQNGLQKAVRKIGKRLMFRVDLFDQWIEKQSAGSKDRN